MVQTTELKPGTTGKYLNFFESVKYMGMIAKCPRCGKKADIENNPFRPFCSDRCKLIDLGNWLSGNYRIPTTESPADENQTPDPQKDPDRE